MKFTRKLGSSVKAGEANASDKAWQVRVEFDLNGKREFTHVITYAASEAEAKKNAVAYVSREYSGSKDISVMDTKALPKHNESFDFGTPHFKTREYEASGADESSYTTYYIDHETERVVSNGVFPTWRKAYASLHDGSVWDQGDSNNFVFHGNHLQQIYKYKLVGRSGKWSGTNYGVIFDREISEDPVAYIKKHFALSRYNMCHFNESAKSYVLAHKGPNDTTYCKNKAGDWTTHIEDAWEGSGPDSFSAEMKRNFADTVHCDTEDLEVIAVENHMKGYSKTEGKFTEIKAAIKAAWSAAEVKWFRLDLRESTERLDVYPIASDNEKVGVDWGVLPKFNTIAQYATDFRTGNSEIEREIPYKDLDDLEKIFVDEFTAMDETLEIGAENGADIHAFTEGYTATKGGKSFPVDVTYNEKPDDWCGNVVPDTYTITVGGDSIEVDATELEKDSVRKGLRILGYDLYEETPAKESKTEESAPYIQRYIITGGTGPESGEERERDRIDVSGDPEQELWDMVFEEIPADYEQRLFVNNDEYDSVIDDDDIAALKRIGLDGFKKKHGIDKITSMGYYTHPWGGMMSDLMDYRIKGEAAKRTLHKSEGRVTSYFVLHKNAELKAIEKIVATLEDTILKDQTVETTANPDGTVSLEIYGRMSPDDVARAIQLPGQLGTSYVDLTVNIED